MPPTPETGSSVPGFEFLQGLMSTAGQAVPGLGAWVTPTLDPEALEKRISELKTVQFWLEQNARLLGSTIQALEVQRMTLSTLKSMNVSLSELGKALEIPVPAAAPERAPAPESSRAGAPAPRPEPAPEPAPGGEPAPAAEPAQAAVDPLRWWGALAQQFTEVATRAAADMGSPGAAALAAATGQPAAARAKAPRATGAKPTGKAARPARKTPRTAGKP